MSTDTVLAAYDTPQNADAAIHDLKLHGVPAAAISLHARGDALGVADAGVTPPPQQHFIPRMFGYEPTPEQERETLVYEHSLETGASVVVVHGQRPNEIDVIAILTRHRPSILNNIG